MSEDPHERELDELEKQIQELESADDISGTKVEPTDKSEKQTKEAEKSYEEKTQEDWKRNDKQNDTRLQYQEDEIEIIEEDM